MTMNPRLKQLKKDTHKSTLSVETMKNIEYIEFDPAKHVKGGDIKNVMNSLQLYYNTHKNLIIKQEGKRNWKEAMDFSCNEKAIYGWFEERWHRVRLGIDFRDIEVLNVTDIVFDYYKIME